MAINPFRYFPFEKSMSYECLVGDEHGSVCKPYPMMTSDPLIVDVNGRVQFFFWDSTKKQFRKRYLSVCMGSSEVWYAKNERIVLRIKCSWCFDQTCSACIQTSTGRFKDCECCVEHREQLWAPGGKMATELARMYASISE